MPFQCAEGKPLIVIAIVSFMTKYHLCASARTLLILPIPIAVRMICALGVA